MPGCSWVCQSVPRGHPLPGNSYSQLSHTGSEVLGHLSRCRGWPRFALLGSLGFLITGLGSGRINTPVWGGTALPKPLRWGTAKQDPLTSTHVSHGSWVNAIYINADSRRTTDRDITLGSGPYPILVCIHILGSCYHQRHWVWDDTYIHVGV